MIGILAICECGRKFLRGIYPQKKCYVCDSIEVTIKSKGNDRAFILMLGHGKANLFRDLNRRRG
ncbi:hypothetical protein LCGC14_2364650 [marine sediment metagenome]|uniref:Uncharacterized protein n=1 Tax=marine sediment metagenome TaxID=412755 RepID=A0A0F9C5H1_9ZZZZ